MDIMNEHSIQYDSILALCQDEQRRIVLATLAEEQQSLTINDLAKTIHTDTQQTPMTAMPDDKLSEIGLSLHHVHLPKLDSAGLISYDAERQTVEPTELFDRVQPTMSPILAADPELETPTNCSIKHSLSGS